MKKKAIEKIENSEQRQAATDSPGAISKKTDAWSSSARSHCRLQPLPFDPFIGVFDQTWKTLTSLVTGFLSPKALAGPVGIVQALQASWSNGIKDALFWLGFVSLNLAIFESSSHPRFRTAGTFYLHRLKGSQKNRSNLKTMEKLILPFFDLLVVLFIYLTYQDIVKLLHRPLLRG